MTVRVVHGKYPAGQMIARLPSKVVSRISACFFGWNRLRPFLLMSYPVFPISLSEFWRFPNSVARIFCRHRVSFSCDELTAELSDCKMHLQKLD